MKSINVEELGCFQEVANVIGVHSARVELQKVVYSESTTWMQDGLDKCLQDSFQWDTTPQDDHFWERVCDGDIPIGYTPLEDTIEDWVFVKDYVPSEVETPSANVLPLKEVSSKELFIRYMVTTFEDENYVEETFWVIVPCEEGKTSKVVVETFESGIIAGGGDTFEKVDILGVNIV